MPDDSNTNLSREEEARRQKLAAFWERATPLVVHLKDATVNEIAVNDSYSLWLLRSNGSWEQVAAPEIDLNFLEGLGARLANYAAKSFDRRHTSLSTMLPSGERVEMTHPPACPESTRYLNIRKHSAKAIPHAQLVENGYYKHTQHEFSMQLSDHDRKRFSTMLSPEQQMLWSLAEKKNWVEFVKLGVQYRQNIVISGATGTGKTSYMRALIEFIARTDRIVTVEDSHEIQLPDHPNHNHLFYRKNDGDDGALADEILRSVMRKTPTRVLMAELRSEEAMTYLSDVVTSGHPGGITTTHAGSPKQALLRLAYLVRKAPAGQSMSMDTVQQLLNMAVDVVIQLDWNRERGRHVPSIYYDPMYSLSLLG